GWATSSSTRPPRARGQYAGSSPRTNYRCATADGARSLGDWCSSALAERRLRSSGASSGPLAISSALRICQHTCALNGAPSCHALAKLVSVRKHFESFESFVIQRGDLVREGHPRCGRRRTADVTTAANCDIRVT